MAAQASIVINDGLATPVAHTFVPKGAKRNVDGKDVAVWRDESVSPLVGKPTLTETHTAPNTNGREKFRIVMDIPVLEQASSGGTFVPPPTRAFGSIGVIEVWVHQSALQPEIDNIAAYVKNLAASTYFATLIKQRETSW